MKCYMLKMRESGIAIPKGRLFDRYHPANIGILSLRETTSSQLHRMSRRAEFKLGNCTAYLLDAQILWIEGGRFVLTGFEQVKTHEGVAEYAQSWLIITHGAPTGQEGR